jgi:GNAT superfamily N-acetyltransferase
MFSVARFSVAPALLEDLDLYVRLAQEAQAFLRGRGLAQWVPPAHAPYRRVLVAGVAAGDVFKVNCGAETVAFFRWSAEGPEWWEPYPAAASYVSGIVVARDKKGSGVGRLVLDWCAARAQALNHDRLRLDCHAGNDWLCSYYAALGFQEVARVETHPGYVCVLREKVFAPPANDAQHPTPHDA